MNERSFLFILQLQVDSCQEEKDDSFEAFSNHVCKKINTKTVGAQRSFLLCISGGQRFY
jgi:hypothetical protein